MGAPEAAVVVLVLALTLGGGLVLYWLVRAEHGRRRTMGRDRAERAARRDTSDRDDR